MNFGRRQVKGIVGMVFSVLGAVAWFFQVYILTILWGAAMVIVFSLNKRRKQGQRR